MYRQLLSLGIATGVLIPNIVLAEQAIVQQGSTGATAIGNNNRSTSRVRQSATQSQTSHRNFYFDGQGQTTIQQGQSTTAGVGNDNLVESQIEQNSRQNRQANYSNNTLQRSEQNATSNLEAIGDNNRINSSARQYNRQNRWK